METPDGALTQHEKGGNLSTVKDKNPQTSTMMTTPAAASKLCT
jgi:hypothetical protein